MAETVLFLDQDEDGIYELPALQTFNADEPLDTLENLVEPTKERGKLRRGDKTFMVTIHVEHVAGVRYPYIAVNDLGKLK